MIGVETLAGMHGLNYSEPHKPKVLGYGHTKIGWEINKKPILAMGTDKIISIY
jgi:hypothetical protein